LADLIGGMGIKSKNERKKERKAKGMEEEIVSKKKKCFSCDKMKTNDNFSKNQWKKNDDVIPFRICNICLQGNEENVQIIETTLTGDLNLHEGKMIIIRCLVNDREVDMHVDTGASHTQINSHTAKDLGLLGHKKLLGRSKVATGFEKYDYLCDASLTVLDVTRKLVIKVGPLDQPNLFGLDAMFLFSMSLIIPQLKFKMEITTIKNPPFYFLDMSEILKNLNINVEDLEPIDNLPPPFEAYKEQVNLGTQNSVIDLGCAFGFYPFWNVDTIINL